METILPVPALQVTGAFHEVSDALSRMINLMRQIAPPPASRLRELPPGVQPYQQRGLNAGPGGQDGPMGQNMGSGMPDIFPRGHGPPQQMPGRQGPMGHMGGMEPGMDGGIVPPGFRAIAGGIVARFRSPQDQNSVRRCAYSLHAPARKACICLPHSPSGPAQHHLTLRLKCTLDPGRWVLGGYASYAGMHACTVHTPPPRAWHLRAGVYTCACTHLPPSPYAPLPLHALQPVVTEFRMMVPLAVAGKLIGKGGDVLKQARAQMRCNTLQIHPQPPSGLPFRVLELSSTEPAGSGHCAAVDALFYYADQVVSGAGPGQG